MSSPGEDLAGERLFARYAHAPNALGYCGPADARVLVEAATGGPFDAEAVRRVARQFSGAWPYQQLMGELTGLDPLGLAIGRAYWTGSDLTDQINHQHFGELLLERFGRQAGHYWAHLTPDLLAEAAPTHAFHVFGIYPWTRLLRTGAPEPVEVLEGCRIRVGEVCSVGADSLSVVTDSLTWDGTRLAITPASEQVVAHRLNGDAFVTDIELGDTVAIHWGFACDRLSTTEAEYVLQSTEKQLAVTNVRLARAL